jgi:hypothetical protein
LIRSTEGSDVVPTHCPYAGTSILADQEPCIAWLRRGIGRDRIFVEPKLYEPIGTAEAIQKQSRQRFGRTRQSIDKQFDASTR